MVSSFYDSIKNFQATTFRLDPHVSIKNFDQAVEFVNERGVILFWPVKGVQFPSLWAAVAGDRPVPNEHDDPGHVTWGWKDSALGKHVWYYAKVLRNRATFISLDILPYFYALSDNYGSPKDDYLIAYQDGNLTKTEKLIYEMLLNNGPMHTIDLRRVASSSEKSNHSQFIRALERLQEQFRIVPVGIANAGRWNYAFIYDLTSKHYPELLEQARNINVFEARKKLTQVYFLSLGASDEKNFQGFYRWELEATKLTLRSLVLDGFLDIHTESENVDRKFYCLPFLKM